MIKALHPMHDAKWSQYWMEQQSNLWGEELKSVEKISHRGCHKFRFSHVFILRLEKCGHMEELVHRALCAQMNVFLPRGMSHVFLCCINDLALIVQPLIRYHITKPNWHSQAILIGILRIFFLWLFFLCFIINMKYLFNLPKQSGKALGPNSHDICPLFLLEPQKLLKKWIGLDIEMLKTTSETYIPEAGCFSV